jgi:hypothetical protein
MQALSHIVLAVVDAQLRSESAEASSALAPAETVVALVEDLELGVGAGRWTKPPSQE